jgi:hypothetical protein
LNLASADASTMPQSELLSYLLFGRGTLELTGTTLPGSDILVETLLGTVSDFAAVSIETLGLPLDIIQLRLGGNGFEGLGSPTLVVGSEVSNNLFLTLEYGITGLFGEQSTTAASGSSAESYAVRLEWRMDPRTSVRAGLESGGRRRMIRGLGVALPTTQQRRQATVELRRRWRW